ncbi:hypothetical protein [Persicirhabdus sediminis]|uniref:Uncharacterized protein n=1 Tax=Persicirhabdus sediminis TaxID=454144 RepID=A0A8J7SMS5_9BACT|nr:hypothetical protein [Persicirhabdus sediminis]MBK1791283.1 hypothetical protein [Persicirhabdus sediminis]
MVALLDDDGREGFNAVGATEALKAVKTYHRRFNWRKGGGGRKGPYKGTPFALHLRGE